MKNIFTHKKTTSDVVSYAYMQVPNRTLLSIFRIYNTLWAWPVCKFCKICSFYLFYIGSWLLISNNTRYKPHIKFWMLDNRRRSHECICLWKGTITNRRHTFSSIFRISSKTWNPEMRLFV